MEPKSKTTRRVFRASALSDLELLNVDAQTVVYRGRRAARVVEQPGTEELDVHALAILANSDFQDGVIEATVAGLPRADADKGARGFIGIAFRVAPRGEQFECFYLRPTNGRADDQLRRNHTTQYVSHPDFPWYKLREENPGVYESYTDVIAGAWTKMKIVVAETRAQLYVNDAEQPCLIVNDLRLGHARGAIALWIGSGTEAYLHRVAWDSS